MDWGALAGAPRDIKATRNRLRARRLGRLRRELDAEAHAAWAAAVKAEMPHAVLDRLGRLA